MDGKRVSLRAKSASLLLASLLCAASGARAGVPPGEPPAEPNDKHYFRIDERSLTSAIQTLSRQADIQIITSVDTAQRPGTRVVGLI